MRDAMLVQRTSSGSSSGGAQAPGRGRGARCGASPRPLAARTASTSRRPPGRDAGEIVASRAHRPRRGWKNCRVPSSGVGSSDQARPTMSKSKSCTRDWNCVGSTWRIVASTPIERERLSTYGASTRSNTTCVDQELDRQRLAGFVAEHRCRRASSRPRRGARRPRAAAARSRPEPSESRRQTASPKAASADFAPERLEQRELGGIGQAAGRRRRDPLKGEGART